MKLRKKDSPIFFLRFTLIILTIFPDFLHGKTIDYHLKIYYKDGAPDGVEARKILTANGNFPGELLEGKVGDTFKIRVTNDLDAEDGVNNALALHWHGIKQKGSQFNDGAEFVTQCTIPPGKSMTYEFDLQQTGTYWWHAHTGIQYTEGLYGPIVIHPDRDHSRERDSYSRSHRYGHGKRHRNSGENHSGEDDYDESDVDKEDQIIVLLSDWNHLRGAEIAAWFLSPLSEGNEPIPDSGLLNGRGRYPCDVAESQSPSLPCSTSAQIIPRFYATRGKTYKIRVINAAGFTSFDFTIDNHLMEVIELDGNLVDRHPRTRKKYSDEDEDDDNNKHSNEKEDHKRNPNLVNVFTIHPAQRVSFLIKIDEETDIDLFWIRAKILKSMFPDGVNINQNPEALIGQVLGILEYENGRKMQTKVGAPYQYQSIFDPVVVPPEDPLPETKSVFKLHKEDSENNKIWRLKEQRLSFSGGSAPQPKIVKRYDDHGRDYDRHGYGYGKYWDFSRKFKQEEIFEVNLILNGVVDDQNVTHLTFNNIIFTPDPEDKPILAKILDKEEIPKAVNPFHIPHRSIVQIVVSNLDGGGHPLHKHGGYFWVLGAGKENDGPFKGTANDLDLDGPARDTAFVEANSWLVIRYVADNPGAWLFHCHIQWHVISGLSLVLLEGEKEIRQRTEKIPSEARKVCQFNDIDL